jgi:hypothetical protein
MSDMPPEARLVKRIQAYITTKGGRSFKIMGDEEGRQEAGIPDLLVCYRGFFIGLEVKQPGAEHTVRPRQKHILKQIEESGGIAEVVSSVEQVAMILEVASRRR